MKKLPVSLNALALARQVDQLASKPGTYFIELVVSPYGRTWDVIISEKQTIRIYQTKKEKNDV